MDGYRVVVTKSTVPVGTADAGPARRSRPSPRTPFDVVSNPEFLKEGAAIDDFMKPDRVVIGSDSAARDRDHARALRAVRAHRATPSSSWTTASAEMTKYAANALLATRISFMNEIANLCERVGADVDHVRRGIGSDRRIGHHFLFPGVGYGGSCFPKDVKAVIHTAHEHGMRVPAAARGRGGERRAEAACSFDKVRRASSATSLRGRRFAVWGLAFKPRTDDMREAPSLTVDRGAARARAPRSRRTTPRRSARRGASSATASATTASTTTRSTAPTRCSSSPSGTSSAAPTSRA